MNAKKINTEKNKSNNSSYITKSSSCNYDIYGKDIVCASVSALTLCTINNISALEDNTIKITMNDNEFKIEVIKATKINTKLLNNMIKSLSQIEEKYSKNIKILYRREL